MVDLVETVARAIRDELRKQAVLWEDDDQTEDDAIMFVTGCSAYLPAITQAAIAAVFDALETPSEGMIEAAWEAIDAQKRKSGLGKLGPGPAAREVWQAMLAKAREEMLNGPK